MFSETQLTTVVRHAKLPCIEKAGWARISGLQLMEHFSLYAKLNVLVQALLKITEGMTGCKEIFTRPSSSSTHLSGGDQGAEVEEEVDFTPREATDDL